MPLSPEKYESPYSKALGKIKSRAKGNEVLEDIAREEDPKARMARETNCVVVRKIVDKCLDNYRNGEYSFGQTVDMISAAMKKMK